MPRKGSLVLLLCKKQPKPQESTSSARGPARRLRQKTQVRFDEMVGKMIPVNSKKRHRNRLPVEPPLAFTGAVPAAGHSPHEICNILGISQRDDIAHLQLERRVHRGRDTQNQMLVCTLCKGSSSTEVRLQSVRNFTNYHSKRTATSTSAWTYKCRTPRTAHIVEVKRITADSQRATVALRCTLCGNSGGGGKANERTFIKVMRAVLRSYAGRQPKAAQRKYGLLRRP